MPFLRDPVGTLNYVGSEFLGFASAMTVQVGVLVLVLACLDAVWLKRSRAAIRYGVWSLVLVKLMLPVWLQGPLSLTGALDVLPRGAAQGGQQVSPADSTVVRNSDIKSSASSVASERAAAHSMSAADKRPRVLETPVSHQNGLGHIRWQGWLFLGWVLGSVLLFALFIRRWAEVRSLVAAGTPAAKELKELTLECQKRLGMEKVAISVLVSDCISTPAICGFWRATILIPRALINQLSEEQLRLVLIHELSHWKRFDLQVNCLQTVLAIAYFYNPIVWGVNAFLRRLREEAVDEAVLATVHSSAQRYSSTLLDIVSLSRQSPELSLRMVGVVESRKALPSRIRRILAFPAQASARLGLSGMAVVVLAGLVLLPLAGRRAGTIADEPPPVEKQADQSQEKTKAQEAEEDNIAVVGKDELAGVVRDEKGKPLADVTVDAWSWHPGNETKTDANGRFRLKGLDPKEKVEVQFTKEGYSPKHFPQRPTGEEGWIVVLGRKTYFEGAVLGTDGKPVAGAAIRASFGPVEGDGVVISDVTTEGKSREDGTFRLYVAPGIYDIQVSGGARGVLRQSDVLIGYDEAKRLDVQLQPGVRFVAKVVDSVTNKPVKDFILWQWRGAKRFSRSDADGQIVLEGMIPGETAFNCGGGEEVVHESGIRFYLHGPFGRWWSADSSKEWMRFQIDDKETGWQRNFDDLEFDLKEGMAPVTILVEQGVEVSGRVTDPKGNGVANATVAPAKTGSGNSLTGDTRYSVRTEKDGSYRVVLPASNNTKYNLVVHDGDYQEWRQWANGVSEPMQTKPGQKIEGLNLQLTEPAIIRGRVMRGKRPVAGLKVRASAADTLENRYYDPTTETKDDGTFELKFVRAGEHFVQVEPFWLRADDAPDGSKKVKVKAGETLEGVELIAAPAEPVYIPPLDLQ